MDARLYGVSISHPAAAARLMLHHKGIEHEWITMQPGTQAVRMRLAGFRGGTVPGLKMNGRRVVGSRRISRFLDEVRPEPPLFPADPERRRAVEEAEAWGEAVLRPVPRRLFRWALRNDPDVRRSFGNVPGPLILPIAAFYARREDARSLDRIEQDWAETPAHLDHVDRLIADGVIGGAELNAADFQIATTVRLMLNFEDYAPLIAGRPCEALARRVWPEYRYRVPPLRRRVTTMPSAGGASGPG